MGGQRLERDKELIKKYITKNKNYSAGKTLQRRAKERLLFVYRVSTTKIYCGTL